MKKVLIFTLLFACLFGGIGAMFGMVIFNHKTSKALCELQSALF